MRATKPAVSTSLSKVPAEGEGRGGKEEVRGSREHTETRVTVTASFRVLDHDGRWSTYDENVLKLSRVAFWGVIRTLLSNINIYYPPSLQLPAYNRRSAGIRRSWCLLSITSLVALGSANQYGTPSKASIISKTCPPGSFYSS